MDALQVRLIEGIGIHDDDSADARAGECFNSRRTRPTCADHGGRGVAKPESSFVAENGVQSRRAFARAVFTSRCGSTDPGGDRRTLDGEADDLQPLSAPTHSTCESQLAVNS